MTLVRAAGGLVWRAGGDAPRVAVVHRPRRRDWSLPKGKLEAGEAWAAAALREVEEETGARARLVDFAGATRHAVRRGPKVVLYWHMEEVAAGPRAAADEEVDEVAWLAVDDALARLDHANERGLLAAAALARPGALGPDAAGALARARAAVLAAATALPEGGDAGPLLDAVDALARLTSEIVPTGGAGR